MIRYVAMRLLALIPIGLGVSIVVFITLRLIPGDVIMIMLGEAGSIEAADALRVELGLDRPWYTQFLQWFSGLLVGDLGVSLRTGESVRSEILQRLPASLQLTSFALILSLIIGIPPGILSAIRRNTATDMILRITSFLGLTIPNFWLALLLVYTFSLHLGYFPTGGFRPFWSDPLGALHFTFLPALALALPSAATLMRFTRSSLLEVMSQDYVRTARAKGLPERIVVNRHALKNAMVNVLTVLGLQISFMIGGSIAIETIFRWPGMGQLSYYAIGNRDYTMAQGAALVIALLFAFVTVLVDILYTLVDPRIRYD